MRLNLEEIRRGVMAWTELVRDTQGLYGSYRGHQLGDGGMPELLGPKERHRPSLYASCDIALLRVCMGEDLMQTLTEQQRREWTAHINTFAAVGGDGHGVYIDTFGHSQHHANGMVIGALGVLGGKQRDYCALYDGLDTPEKAVPWLEQIDWKNQWGGSHLFWGAMHCFSLSKRCTPEWLDTVIGWLDANLDPETGWWRKGVPHADRNQPLGGSVHILPVYEHHDRAFPYPERLIDSVLGLQYESGAWMDPEGVFVLTYLDLDALYALRFMQTFAPAYRKADIDAALDRYGDAVEREMPRFYSWLEPGSKQHPHFMLSAIGCFGLLQQFRPDDYPDTNTWTDIFTHKPFYDTAAVEVLPGEDA
jgi:hypothetical protein